MTLLNTTYANEMTVQIGRIKIKRKGGRKK